MRYGNISSALDLESFNNADSVALTFFYYGCNFRCGFCHNHKMLASVGRVIPEEELYAVLRRAKRNWVSTAVVTGGEPALDIGLKNFLNLLKSMQFRVKLDTNGSCPEVLEQLLSEKLVDYIAMDIKGVLAQYPEITGWGDAEKIKRSIRIVRSTAAYEFRTTVVPRYHGADEICGIGSLLHGSRRYVLQQFRPDLDGGCLSPEMEKERTYNEAELLALAELVRKDFEEVRVKCS